MTKAQHNTFQTTLYFVETKTEEQATALCQSVEHFYEQGGRVHVVAGSSLAAQRLDQLLWTFAQASFIPHRIAASSQGDPTVEPVIITVGPTPVSGFTVLVCDAPVEIEFMGRYRDVVHFVLLDDSERRNESRSLWQTARDRGFRVVHVAYASRGTGFGAYRS